MRQVLGIVARSDNGSSPQDRARFLQDAVDRARETLGWSCPVVPARPAEEMWTDGANVVLLGWHDEGNVASEFVWTAPQSKAWLLGYRFGHDAEILDEDNLLDASRNWGGAFAVIRARGNTIEAVTDATRSTRLYYVQTPTVRMVASRAIHLHLIAQSERQKSSDPIPKFDLLAMRNLARVGNVIENRTPFIDVSAVPLAACTVIAPDKIDTTVSPEPEQIPETEVLADWTSTVAAAANAVMDAFGPLRGQSLRMGVTGGRDSRMLTAALHARGDIDFRLFTGGPSDSPDALVGAMIAQAVGVPHHRSDSGGHQGNDSFAVDDLLVRIVKDLDIHDSHSSGWDHSRAYRAKSNQVSISGVGGEIFRGGRNAVGADEVTPEIAERTIRSSLLAGRYFNRKLDRLAQIEAEPWIKLATQHPYKAMDDAYFVNRNSQWVSVRRMGVRMTSRTVDPLLDNRVIQLVRAIPARLRWLELLSFDMIALLAPQLRDMPIEGSRWRFERLGPSPLVSDDAMAKWDKRYSMDSTAVVPATSWKHLPTPALRSMMKTFILDRLDASTAELFDRKMLIRLLDEGRVLNSQQWHIATALVSMQVPWYKTARLPWASDQ
jgi:asparagine synthetase B (glutamine-hydrolysing)